jgi:hypothetical protein
MKDHIEQHEDHEEHDRQDQFESLFCP